jgi:hypothetical protein
VNRLYELWGVENAGHSGIDTEGEYRKEYFYKLRGFIKRKYYCYIILDIK